MSSRRRIRSYGRKFWKSRLGRHKGRKRYTRLRSNHFA